MRKSAVLLLNLGSPDSTSVPDVRRYLEEFLGDERVIDRPANVFLRSLLVKQVICRFRAPKSAHAYESIWTPAGSPLILTSRQVQAKLQARVPLPVELAMNYGNPSIPDVLHRLANDGVDRLLLFPSTRTTPCRAGRPSSSKCSARPQGSRPT
jgi:ferrochelatase